MKKLNSETSVEDVLPPSSHMKRRMAEEAKIVVLDDEPMVVHVVQKGLARFLKTENITAFDQAEQVIEYIRKQFIPHLIIADRKLPGLDGFRMCKQIKDMDLGEKAPVMILSSGELFQRGEDCQRCNKCNIFYLQKPYRTEEMREMVLNALNWHPDFHREQ